MNEVTKPKTNIIHDEKCQLQYSQMVESLITIMMDPKT